MTKKTRTILFFVCFFLFLVTAPSVIFYSQGYRIDFENKKIVKTGAFYFKVSPKGAEIFVGGKLKKKTDFFFEAALIENLLPKKHLVEIKKPGYLPWKKSLEIKEEKVTEAKNIVLVPEDLGFEILEKNLKDFFFSPDEKKIIFKEEILTEDEKKSWSLKLYDLKEKTKSHLIEEKEISKNGAFLSNLIWAPDGKRIILETEIKAEKKYFLLDLKESPVLLRALDFLEDIKSFSFQPTNQNILFSKKDLEEDFLALFEADTEGKISEPILEDVVTYKISGQNIFWISKDGFLQKSDLAGKTQKLSLEPLSLKKAFDYQIEVFNAYIFLREEKSLFLFNEKLGKFEKVDQNITDFEIAPDSKKVCFWSDNEIEILFLKEGEGQPEKETGEKLFLTRFSKKIGRSFWYTSHYLIFNVNSEIKIIEIDDRDEIQIWNLSNFENPKIYFNQKDRKLYILSKENLFISERF